MPTAASSLRTHDWSWKRLRATRTGTIGGRPTAAAHGAGPPRWGCSSSNCHGIGFLARRTMADRAHRDRCRPPNAEDRGGDGRESSTSGGQVLHAVRPLARRHAARLPRPRQRTSPTLSARAVWVRNQTHSWYRDATTPFFSPDGHWIGFWRAEDRILRKVSLAGGSPIEIAQTNVPIVALWTSNDEIVIESGDQHGELWSIPASGGTPKAIAVRDRSDGELISLRGRVPGSNDLLVASPGDGGTWLDVLSRETGKRRRLLRGGSNIVARYTGTGHLVFSDGDALRAVPVNQRFEPVGDPRPVLHGIDHDYRHANVALSDNGTVIYVAADRVREAGLVWLDRDGNATPVPGGRVPFETAALSPDGREVAGDLVEGTKVQVWVRDLERGAKRVLVSEGNSFQPIWSRDGRFITYWSTPGNSSVFRKRADGTGSAELLMRGRPSLILEDWSPDGRSLLFSEYTNRGDTDVWVYSDGKAMPLLSSPSNEAEARFSLDGRFIAFDSDDGGVGHVYVQPFPGPGPRTAISAEEGGRPVWINGGRLLFLSAGRMMVADVQTHPDLRVGQTRPLNERRDVQWRIMPSPDGRRFLMLSRRAMEGPIELRIILNWFQELERLAPHPPR